MEYSLNHRSWKWIGSFSLNKQRFSIQRCSKDRRQGQWASFLFNCGSHASDENRSEETSVNCPSLRSALEFRGRKFPFWIRKVKCLCESKSRGRCSNGESMDVIFAWVTDSSDFLGRPIPLLWQAGDKSWHIGIQLYQKFDVRTYPIYLWLIAFSCPRIPPVPRERFVSYQKRKILISLILQVRDNGRRGHSDCSYLQHMIVSFRCSMNPICSH